MEQLVQKLRTGVLKNLEVPVPKIAKGHLLVKNRYSLISAGTEGSTVKTARKSYVGKVKERPEQVKQVIQTLKAQGPVQTYRAVMKKLDSYSSLGYSCCGQVIDISEDVIEFNIGDLVACGGLSASHAEVVSVPVNLCVKISPSVDLKQAVYNTLGAIAMQGVRQADLRLGESCAVIGLGLLGQLTGLLLKASGIRVIGIDIDPLIVDIAEKHSVDLALVRNKKGISERILEFTNGLGCDAVIITAASNSLDPINFAGSISRKRGTIVVVGDVPTGFNRDPHFYKKELQVKMSCSYGPGRYDPNYEDKGLDYPPGYVRWTEKRNMQAFQTLLQSKKIDVGYLTTHVFKLEDAPDAYNMLLEKSEQFIGILIEYDFSKEIRRSTRKVIVAPQESIPAADSVNIGFIGAGSYAQGNLLPNILKQSDVALKGVMTLSGTTSRSVTERFGFEFCTSEEKDLLDNDGINTVFVATRHDSHAEYVIKALKRGLNVFVEKPLCISEQELNEIFELIAPEGSNKQSYRSDKNNNLEEGACFPILMVGYNRRFAPLTKILKNTLGVGPMAMVYRINAGMIPADSWIQDVEIGGGRVIGEVCHFVDYLTYLNGSLPVSVYAASMKDSHSLNDVINISLTFANGSIGTISYLANGSNKLPKERVEIFANQCSAILDDFKALSIYASGCKKTKKLFNQDKGQKEGIRCFIDTILNGSQPPIPLEEIYSASLTTFKILESVRSRKCVEF